MTTMPNLKSARGIASLSEHAVAEGGGSQKSSQPIAAGANAVHDPNTPKWASRALLIAGWFHLCIGFLFLVLDLVRVTDPDLPGAGLGANGGWIHAPAGLARASDWS